MNGRSGNHPLDQPGRNFKNVERGIVRIAETRAAVEVVLLQKNPKRNSICCLFKIADTIDCCDTGHHHVCDVSEWNVPGGDAGCKWCCETR